MSRALAVDLFCGLGGWTEGLLAEGYDVVGFDLEQHAYGPHRYPAQLVLQDVCTLHGAQFRDAALIVASPPCQAYSYMAMPWTRAKAKAAWYRDPAHPERIAELNELFDACFRLQREASEAAGRKIPLVVENVCGAQPWVGRARWHYGSYYLWGDVPALMPIVSRRRAFKGGDRNIGRATGEHQWNTEASKNPGFRFDGRGESFQSESVKNGGREFPNEVADRGVKQDGLSGPAWLDHGAAAHPSKSSKRKAASALIAKIPLELARWIASVYRPS